MMSPLLNTAFLFVLVTISSNVGTAAAERQFVRRPDSERELPPIVRKLKMDEDTFTRSYTAVTAPKDITFVNPPNVQGLLTVQGSYFISFAGVFRTSSIELVPTTIGVGNLDFADQLVLQPKTIPSIDDDFTFGGKCTTTNGKTLTQIISHSCFYDLCLGSPTDCVNIYAGTRFNFSPIKEDSNRAYFASLQNNGNLDPEEGVSRNDKDKRVLQTNNKFGSRKSFKTNNKKRVVRGDITENEAPVSNTTPQTDNSRNAAGSRKLQNQLVVPADKLFQTFNGNDLAQNGRFPLPPSFPGFCIGGTGRYHGIKCSFDLITVAQRSVFQTTVRTESPTSSPTLTDEPTIDKNQNRDLSLEEKEEENRELFGRDDDPDDGVIVQKIFITSTQRLPLGPKAI